METSYAPAVRDSEENIRERSGKFYANDLINEVLDAVPEAVMILNQQRQIIFVNKATLQTVGLDNFDTICGLRPGELLQCSRSSLTEGGCGTTEFCRYCGAVNAILDSQKGETVINECRITKSATGNALDLKVKASPFEFEGELFTIFSILDISDEKSREMLERIFFHDILNTAGGLSGYSELMQDASPEEMDEFKGIIYELSHKIVGEIQSQRQLLAAESGSLEPSVSDVNSLDVLTSVVEGYRKHEAAKDKSMEIESSSESITFKTDQILLARVLGNLVKNALEATEPNHAVKVGCRRKNDRVQFHVNNHQMMTEAVRMQIFQRSFSTKGKGRGLGTYSIKLFTEKYLKGNVWFTSDQTSGTTFYISFPAAQAG